MANKVTGQDLPLPVAGSYFKSKTGSYCYVKKAGLLVKSPVGGKRGRWHKRWCMLMDQVQQAGMASPPKRQVRLEYYSTDIKRLDDGGLSKIKGMIDLGSCIAVVDHDSKLNGYKFVLNIIMADFTISHFAASSKEEMDEWIGAMNEFIFTRTTQSSNYLGYSKNIKADPVTKDYYILSLDDNSSPSNESNSEGSQWHGGPISRSLSENQPVVMAHHQMEIGKKATLKYDSPAEHEGPLFFQMRSWNVAIISRTDIKITDNLSCGEFSHTSKGLYAFSSDSYKPQKVIVKSAVNDQTIIMKEGLLIWQLMHPNVVKLLGAATIGRPKLLVLEYFERGTMKSVLQENRYKLEKRGIGVEKLMVTLLKYCRQVVLGLNYLLQKGIVHGALKASNVFVSNDDTCKISGFGESLKVKDTRYFDQRKVLALSVQWMAPELILQREILQREYTPASDTWSLGIVLYEIWSLGYKPYSDTPMDEIIRKVAGGYRLPPPPGCPRAIYELMIQSWHPKPEKRPELSSIVNCLLQQDDQVLYVELLPAKRVKQGFTMLSDAYILGSAISSGDLLYLDLQESYSNREETDEFTYDYVEDRIPLRGASHQDSDSDTEYWNDPIPSRETKQSNTKKVSHSLGDIPGSQGKLANFSDRDWSSSSSDCSSVDLDEVIQLSRAANNDYKKDLLHCDRSRSRLMIKTEDDSKYRRRQVVSYYNVEVDSDKKTDTSLASSYSPGAEKKGASKISNSKILATIDHHPHGDQLSGRSESYEKLSEEALDATHTYLQLYRKAMSEDSCRGDSRSHHDCHKPKNSTANVKTKIGYYNLKFLEGRFEDSLEFRHEDKDSKNVPERTVGTKAKHGYYNIEILTEDAPPTLSDTGHSNCENSTAETVPEFSDASNPKKSHHTYCNIDISTEESSPLVLETLEKCGNNSDVLPDATSEISNSNVVTPMEEGALPVLKTSNDGKERSHDSEVSTAKEMFPGCKKSHPKYYNIEIESTPSDMETPDHSSTTAHHYCNIDILTEDGAPLTTESAESCHSSEISVPLVVESKTHRYRNIEILTDPETIKVSDCTSKPEGSTLEEDHEITERHFDHRYRNIEILTDPETIEVSDCTSKPKDSTLEEDHEITERHFDHRYRNIEILTDPESIEVSDCTSKPDTTEDSTLEEDHKIAERHFEKHPVPSQSVQEHIETRSDSTKRSVHMYCNVEFMESQESAHKSFENSENTSKSASSEQSARLQDESRTYVPQSACESFENMSKFTCQKKLALHVHSRNTYQNNVTIQNESQVLPRPVNEIVEDLENASKPTNPVHVIQKKPVIHEQSKSSDPNPVHCSTIIRITMKDDSSKVTPDSVNSQPGSSAYLRYHGEPATGGENSNNRCLANLAGNISHDNIKLKVDPKKESDGFAVLSKLKMDPEFNKKNRELQIKPAVVAKKKPLPVVRKLFKQHEVSSDMQRESEGDTIDELKTPVKHKPLKQRYAMSYTDLTTKKDGVKKQVTKVVSTPHLSDPGRSFQTVRTEYGSEHSNAQKEKKTIFTSPSSSKLKPHRPIMKITSIPESIEKMSDLERRKAALISSASKTTHSHPIAKQRPLLGKSKTEEDVMLKSSEEKSLDQCILGKRTVPKVSKKPSIVALSKSVFNKIGNNETRRNSPSLASAFSHRTRAVLDERESRKLISGTETKQVE